MEQPKSTFSRRTLFAGAATVGAVAATATLLHRLPPQDGTPTLKPPPENGGGYQLTEHVKRYYQTARN